MKNIRLLFKRSFCAIALLLPLLGGFGCVSAGKYDAEVNARMQCEGRETALTGQLSAQLQEREQLVQQLAESQRRLGALEKNVEEKELALASKQRQLGESSEKMTGDIARLQADLGDRNARIAKMNTALQLVTDAQREREKALQTILEELKKQYQGKLGDDISIAVDQDNIVLTFSDKSLFAGNIMNIPEKGVESLRPLATVLAAHPDLDAEIRAYTDNQLPRNKLLNDTWDWSLYRATNATRTLIKTLNINGNQLTPAGRGEFYPVAGNNTAEGRAKNRRTEIVLRVPMPNLPTFIQRP